MEIIPSILTPSKDEAIGVLRALRNGPTWIQIDVIDGIFAGPHTTWPLTDPEWTLMKTGEIGLPEWEQFLFEADLMVSNPKTMAEYMVNAGAARLVFHAGSASDEELIALIAMYGDSTECGVAFQLSHNPEEHKALATAAQMIQIMGVDPIGSQGTPFDTRCLTHVDLIKEMCPGTPVQVDGAVSLETIHALQEHGVDRVAPGSYITKAENPKAAYRLLYTEVHGSFGE